MLRSDGNLLVARGNENLTEFWDVSTDKPRRITSLPGGLSYAFSPDGGYLIAWTGVHDSARVYDLHGKWPRLMAILPNFNVDSASFSPDGKTLYVCGSQIDLAGYDLATGRKVWGVNLPGPSRWVYMAPDGRHLFCYNINGTVYVFRLSQPT